MLRARQVSVLDDFRDSPPFLWPHLTQVPQLLCGNLQLAYAVEPSFTIIIDFSTECGLDFLQLGLRHRMKKSDFSKMVIALLRKRVDQPLGIGRCHAGYLQGAAASTAQQLFAKSFGRKRDAVTHF